MIPDTTESWLYLAGACITATVATFSSNAAIQYINPGLASVAQNTDLIGRGEQVIFRKFLVTVKNFWIIHFSGKFFQYFLTSKIAFGNLAKSFRPG